MFEKLWSKRRIIYYVLVALLFVLCILHLVFGTAADKVEIFFVNVAFSVTVFGIMWYAFYKVSEKSKSFAHFAKHFFFWIGIVAMITELSYFCGGFPNGMSTNMGVCVGLLASIIASSKPQTNNRV